MPGNAGKNMGMPFVIPAKWPLPGWLADHRLELGVRLPFLVEAPRGNRAGLVNGRPRDPERLAGPRLEPEQARLQVISGWRPVGESSPPARQAIQQSLLAAGPPLES